MEIEKLARKLEPLMPREVQQLLRVRETADPELKALVERQIISTAHRILGDFRKKILLSLPPERKAKGPIHLGTILYEKEKWPAGLHNEELLQNLAIFGRSGAGKTNVAFHLLRQLEARKIPFLFLDWKRTARHLIPLFKKRVNLYTPGRSLSPIAFNSFVVPPGLESHVYINQVVDVMADAYTLGDGAKSLVQKALARCYEQGNTAPAVKQVIEELEKIPVKERERGWKISAKRALESLEYARLSSGEGGSQEEMVRNLLESSTIVELDGLDQSSKEFLIPLLCLWLYNVKLTAAAREKLSLVIFLEEAHHVLYGERKKESLMEQLLRQCRELGMAFVVVDQHPHLISSSALGNTYTSICLNLKDPKDITKAAALSLVPEDEKMLFSQLPVGQGVVKLQDRWTRPFLLRFPLLEVKKGSVTDEVLAGYFKSSNGFTRVIKQENETLGLLKSNNDGKDTLGRLRFLDNELKEEAFIFIEDIIKYKDDGVDRRYKRLGFSVDKGNRIKNELIDQGIIDALEVKVGRTRKLVLRVTDGARKMLRLGSGEVSRESLAHEFWKRYYARVFREWGYRVEVEAPRVGGRVDVLAVRPAENGTRVGESVAIEVETGKSEVVENVRKCLRSRFDKVIVVATDEAAFRKAERELMKERLMVKGRVKVVVAGEGRAREGRNTMLSTKN